MKAKRLIAVILVAAGLAAGAGAVTATAARADVPQSWYHG